MTVDCLCVCMYNFAQYNIKSSIAMTNLRVVFLLQLEATKQRLATVTEDKYNSEDKVIKLSDELEKKVFRLFLL